MLLPPSPGIEEATRPANLENGSDCNHTGRLGAWLARRFSGAALARVTELEGGWESNIYRLAVTHDSGVEDLVLRAYPGSSGGTTAAREFAGLRHLHAEGYPVPRVIAAETDAAVVGHPFLVMDWVPGADRTWAEALRGTSLAAFLLLAGCHEMVAVDLVDLRSEGMRSALLVMEPGPRSNPELPVEYSNVWGGREV